MKNEKKRKRIVKFDPLTIPNFHTSLMGVLFFQTPLGETTIIHNVWFLFFHWTHRVADFFLITIKAKEIKAILVVSLGYQWDWYAYEL